MKNISEKGLKNLNFIHESIVRSEWTTIIGEVFPEKYSCFFELFEELKELSTILTQLNYNERIVNREIDSQQLKEFDLKKVRKEEILNKMIQQLIQAKNLVNQEMPVDTNGLSLTLQDCWRDFTNEKVNSIDVEQGVVDANNLLSHYQQRLQETIQKLYVNYNSCKSLYPNLMQNVTVGERHKVRLKQLYLLVSNTREKKGIKNEMPSLETIYMITEAYVECVKAICSYVLELVGQTLDLYKGRNLTLDRFNKNCRTFNLELLEDARAAIYEDLPRMLTIPVTSNGIKVFSTSTLLGYKMLEKLLFKKDISEEELEMYKILEDSQNLSSLHSYRFDLSALRSLLITQNYKIGSSKKMI